MSKMNKTSAPKARPSAMPRSPGLVQDMSRLMRQSLGDALTRLSLPESGDHAPLRVERASSPVAPARLASAHPDGPAAQAQARELYERCLKHYRERVCTPEAGLAVDNVGAAMAHFVAANLLALHGVSATPGVLLRLERQLAGVARRSPAWFGASARERQNCFEQMAILAVLIGESSVQAGRQGQDAIANVQRAARGYLQQLLGLDPAQLALGPHGLSLRGAPVAEGGAAVLQA